MKLFNSCLVVVDSWWWSSLLRRMKRIIFYSSGESNVMKVKVLNSPLALCFFFLLYCDKLLNSLVFSMFPSCCARSESIWRVKRCWFVMLKNKDEDVPFGFVRCIVVLSEWSQRCSDLCLQKNGNRWESNPLLLLLRVSVSDFFFSFQFVVHASLWTRCESCFLLVLERRIWVCRLKGWEWWVLLWFLKREVRSC